MRPSKRVPVPTQLTETAVDHSSPYLHPIPYFIVLGKRILFDAFSCYALSGPGPTDSLISNLGCKT